MLLSSYNREGRNMERFFEDLHIEANTFLMLPGEKTIVYKRQHSFAVIIPIIITAILGLVSMVILTTSMVLLYQTPYVVLFSIGTVTAATLSVITKTCIDWYFHLYIVTNRRILEISYRPFFSQSVNDVLLDQVRCTEIDIKIKGYIHGLIDVGDVIITFDRPTHQQEFILHDIKSPRKIGTLLGDLLNTPKEENSAVWYKRQNAAEGIPYAFTEQLFPKKQQYYTA